MTRLKKLKVESGYRLTVEFDDGLQGTIDLSDELTGPIFEPLRDPELFGRARVGEFGVVSWPNGADLAPEFVYEPVRRQSSQLSTR